MRGGVVLGLRQKIGGNPLRVVVAIGDHQHLGRTGDHIDADRAEDAALGGRDIGIARTGDLVDRRDRRGAVSERRDRLRAADAIDLADAGDRAAASTSGLSAPPGDGTTITSRVTPATFAGTAFISTEDG